MSMIEDNDVVFVDFDDLFHHQGDEFMDLQGNYYTGTSLPPGYDDGTVLNDDGLLVDEQDLNLIDDFASYDPDNLQSAHDQSTNNHNNKGKSNGKSSKAVNKRNNKKEVGPGNITVVATATIKNQSAMKTQHSQGKVAGNGSVCVNSGSASIVSSSSSQHPPTSSANDSGTAAIPPITMTRQQFYKMRPKAPRISKQDPRRLYASAFAAAYNSCDFDEIWNFVTTYCTKDILFVTRWVGSELYVNFPKYLEVRGIESVSEYWFSRCIIVPDYVLELKETKLYVRSDGISTVLTSFTIVCTRLYDSEISDSIICQPAVDKDVDSSKSSSNNAQSSLIPHVKRELEAGEIVESSGAIVQEPGYVKQEGIDAGVNNNGINGELEDEKDSEEAERVEKIVNRVFEKLQKILVQHTATEKRTGFSSRAGRSGMSSRALAKVTAPTSTTSSESVVGVKDEGEANKRRKVETASNGRIDLFAHEGMAGEVNPPTNNSSSGAVPRKRLPSNKSITLLGTATLHLNVDHKIHQMDLTFSLQE